MATEVQVLPDRISKLEIEDFVQNATWRELLVELVDSKKLDPWDIDITRMLDAYIDVIKKMKVLDLRIPANVILAASILLRMKSEILSIYNVEEEAMEQMEQQSVERPAVEVPNLMARMRIQPNKKITLQELMEELDSAMKTQEKRKLYMEEIQMPIKITIAEDIDSRTSHVHSIIKSNMDRLSMTTFAALAKNFNTIEEKMLKLFIPLLFLAQNEIITINQEEFFGEIIIKLLDDTHGKGATKE